MRALANCSFGTTVTSQSLRAVLLLLPCFVLPTAQAQDLFLDPDALPQVLTATRLKQTQAAVPGSMTVIDRELIDASGARDIPELMRLVPGMMVGYNDAAHLSTVNYHGGRQGEARRLQVLIDGRSVYRPGLATVDWSDLPLALEDIERIEVFRGPNTVSYGANALMGVISIITRHPSDSQGTQIKYTQGQRGIRDWYGSQSFTTANSSSRLSVSSQSDDGFDHTDKGDGYRDSRRNTRMQLSTSYTLASDQVLDWQLAASESSNQRNFYNSDALVDGVEVVSDTDKDIKARDYAGSLTWNWDSSPNHSLKIQGSAQRWERTQEWRDCDLALAFTDEVRQLYELSPNELKVVANLLDPTKFTPDNQPFWKYISDPISFGPGQPAVYLLSPEARVLGTAIRDKALDPSGFYTQAVCGDLNRNIDETRFDLEIQDTLSLSDNLRVLSGLSYRHDRSNSETFFGGALSNDIWRLFGHLEWYLTDKVLLQGGAMYEKDQFSGNSLTPRIALNYLITPRHSLRAVYSEAVRSPDMFEDRANWRFTMLNPSVPSIDGSPTSHSYAYAQGPGNLKQEITRSRELGYNGQFLFGLSVDIKVFDDEIRRMISEPLSLSDFEPSNNNQMWFRGAETEINWQLGRQDRLRVTYAYVDFTATQKMDRRLTARNSGSVGWMRSWGAGWSSSLFYYGADMLNERRFERADLRIAKRFNFTRSELELAGILQQRLDDEALTWRENLYDDRQQFYLTAKVSF